MNDVINNILTRRSIRDFSEKEISKEDMEVLLQSAIYAPSGCGKQTWKFTGILNQELISEAADVIAKVLDRDRNTYNFYGATALVVTTNEADSPWGRCDNACAMENMMLAAHSMGIGSVWINQFMGQAENQDVRAFLTKIGVPENHITYGVVALGYSKSEAKGKVEKKSQFEIIE